MKSLFLIIAIFSTEIVPSLAPYGEPARFEFAAGGRLGILQPEYRSDVETDFISVFDLDSGRLAARFPGSDFQLSPDGYTLYIDACPESCSRNDYAVNLPTLQVISSLHTPLVTSPQPALQPLQPHLLSLTLPTTLTFTTPKHPSLDIQLLSVISRKSPITLIGGGEWGGRVDEVRGRVVWVRREGVEVWAGGVLAQGFELVWSDGWVVSYSRTGRELRRRRIGEGRLEPAYYWYDSKSMKLVALKEESIEVWREDGEYVQSRLASAYHPGEFWFESDRLLVYDYYDEETREKTVWNLQTGRPEDYREFSVAKRAQNRPYKVTATAEGLKFWKNTHLLATAVRTESGWIVYTPDGRYDTAPENLDLLSLRELGSASRAPVTGYTPGLLALILRSLD